MINTRGNTYSRGNRNHRDTSQDYWAHSMDELALIDLPAQIDYILKFTGRGQVGFIGHSQGCTLPLMLLSERPEYNDKFNLIMMLGPVTYAQYIQAPFLRQQAKTYSATVSRARAAALQAGAVEAGQQAPATRARPPPLAPRTRPPARPPPRPPDARRRRRRRVHPAARNQPAVEIVRQKRRRFAVLL
jgi:pimeloyl-ACP methyl ester carboxylesterase